MHIKYVDGHYEIVSADNGQFIQSADTWDEALDAANNNGITSKPARLHNIFLL